MLKAPARRALSAALLLASAVGWQRAATTEWLHGTAGVGVRYTVTAVGLSQFAPAPAGPSTDCRWWPLHDLTGLCAREAAAPSAWHGLRAVYPLLQGALWGSIVTLFLVVLAVPRARWVRAVACVVPAACGAYGSVRLLEEPNAAIAVLRGVSLTPDGAGPILAGASVLMALVVAVLQVRDTERV